MKIIQIFSLYSNWVKCKIKKILVPLSLVLASCDPIYHGEVINETKKPIELIICNVDQEKIIDDLNTDIFTGNNNCRKFQLKPDSSLILGMSKGIREPLEYSDLGFKKIIIRSENGLVSAEGENIMDLFSIEPIENMIGINTSKVYRIRIKN